MRRLSSFLAFSKAFELKLSLYYMCFICGFELYFSIRLDVHPCLLANAIELLNGNGLAAALDLSNNIQREQKICGCKRAHTLCIFSRFSGRKILKMKIEFTESEIRGKNANKHKHAAYGCARVWCFEYIRHTASVCTAHRNPGCMFVYFSATAKVCCQKGLATTMCIPLVGYASTF